MGNILSALFGGNPFQKAAGGDPWEGMREPTPAAEMQPLPAQAQPTSRKSAMDGYSPLRDPNGPLARAGWIGSLLATGPTREQAMMQDAGSGQQQAVTGIGRRLESGMTPQRAIFDFANSPEGQEFFTSGGGFTDLANVVKGLSPDPQAAARNAAFGNKGGSDVTAETGSEMSPDRYMKAAERLAAVGDTEGANIALKLAEEARQAAAIKDPPTTDELKEYEVYRKQEKEAGRDPMTWMDYKSALLKKSNPNNPEAAKDAQKFASRLKVDEDQAKAAGEIALKAQNALPALRQIEQMGDKVSGGYKGMMLPYLSRVAATFGMEIKPEWSDAEILNALTQQLMPLVRQPGAVSDYEQKRYEAALPGLMQSKEGRMKMAKALRRQLERTQLIAKTYRESLGEPDLYDKLAALDTPMFDEAELKEFDEIASGKKKLVDAPENGTARIDLSNPGGGLPTISTPEEWEALEPGQKYLNPDGKPKVRGANRPRLGSGGGY